MLNKFKKGLLFFLLLLAFSCTSRQEINLNLDGSGSLDLKVELASVFVNYLYDIAEATTEIKSRKDMVIFDAGELKASLEKYPEIVIEQILSGSQNSLELKLKCRNIASLSAGISQDSRQPLFTFNNRNGVKEFRFLLSKSNYNDIKKFFPLLNEALFENLEPQVNETVSKEDYLDIVEFAMDKEGRKAVLDSMIDVKIKVQGKILSLQGGTLKDGVINIRIPLIDVLLLNQPVAFSVKFQ